MKKLLLFGCIVLMAILNGFDYEPASYSKFKPIFMLRSDLEKNIKIEGPRALKNPGKIYLKDNFIFISEKYYGIHVIDNSNPESPLNKAFIRVDGCVDLAMKNDIVYADNSVDLVALKIKSGLSGIEITNRTKNVFPELASPDGFGLSYKEQQARPQDAVLVRWDKR